MEFILTVLENTRVEMFGTGEYVGSWVFTALAAAGSLMSAYGSYKSGREQQKSASRAAADTRWNAGVIREKGQMQAKEITRQTNRAMSDAAALQAASGFSASDPTDLRQLAEISGAGKWNEIAARYEAEMGAQGEERAARNLRKSGQAAKRAGTLGAAATLIGGAGGFRDAWTEFKGRNA